ncbi:putative nuclease HARBI1 isoform X2 [Bactrocera tryoni]|uniref:putative nuclease HARBI1 isoform X2 n=1 Tax=Bactrocera tryoni TaxID=59916 RepID=UPI001A975E89|nr:putative nuclease HARBI1 isoform X2 [Bactrocera tryoni]
MRMSDEVFYDLLLKVKVFIEIEDTIMRKAISAENRLAITLRFLATGISFEDLKFPTAISAQAIGKIVIETCKAIIKVLKDSIKLPKTPEQWMAVADQFYEKSMFPNCLGALDGKHINISRPSNSGSFYFNYKKTFSIVLLAIVDSNSNFLMVDVGANGRISDGGVFGNSKFFKKLESGSLNLLEPQAVLADEDSLPFVFVSDAAFALRKNVLKPFGHNNLTENEMLFNKTLSSARVKVENAFGILASRFRLLQTTINLCPEKVTTVVLACCYLHNYLRCQSNSNRFEYENIQLSEMEPTLSRNASNEAKTIRLKYCEIIKKLKSL